MRRRSRIFKMDLLSEEQIKVLLDNEVFDTPSFKEHIKEVSYLTKIDEQIVQDVLLSYFKNIMKVLNTYQRITTKINIYGFLSLFIQKGKHLKLK